MPPDITLRFLLDEHYPEWLAAGLRADGLDVASVVGRPELRGASDTEVLKAATYDKRVVVTNDIHTFGYAIAAVPDHVGVVFCHHHRFPRTARGFDRLRTALTALAADPPALCWEPGFVWWLDTPSGPEA